MIFLISFLLLFVPFNRAGGFETFNKIQISQDLPSPKPCFGDECFSSMWCYKGSSNPFDISLFLYRIVVKFDFNDPAQDFCLDLESEDALSFRSFFNLNANSVSERLFSRKQSMLSRFSSYAWYLFSGVQTSSFSISSKHVLEFSPFGETCIQMCESKPSKGKPISSTISLELKNALFSSTNWFLVSFGCGLLIFSKKISSRAEVFYFAGAGFGVLFAVAFILCIFFYFTNRKANPSRNQLGIAFFAQSGFVLLRRQVFDFFADYLDYFLLFGIVIFSSSLVWIHYSLKSNEDGMIRLNSALVDVLCVVLDLIGFWMVIYCIFPSPRVTMFAMMGFTFFTVLNRTELFWNAAMSTKNPSELGEWFQNNHTRIVLRTLPEVADEEEELNDDMETNDEEEDNDD